MCPNDSNQFRSTARHALPELPPQLIALTFGNAVPADPPDRAFQGTEHETRSVAWLLLQAWPMLLTVRTCSVARSLLHHSVSMLGVPLRLLVAPALKFYADHGSDRGARRIALSAG